MSELPPEPKGTTTRVKLNFGEGPILPLFLTGSGMYLAWFGVHYWRSDVRWPTDPVKALLQGKPLPDRTPSDTAEEKLVSQLGAGGGIVAAGPGPAGANAVTGNQAGQVTPGTGSAAANQNTGRLLAAAYGWSSGQQWDDLVKLWNQESGWNNQAENPSSGAYGIPQALPYTKMPKAAWPPRYGGRADPNAQISWGLGYIKGRYGSPSAAWAHEQANNWY